MKVRCPTCGEIYLETTNLFNPAVPANGTMFKLTETYGPNGYNWSCFPFGEYVIGESLECPECGGVIVGPDGKVAEENLLDKDGRPGKNITLPLNYANDAHVCPDCGKLCKNSGSLANHMKGCKGKELAA